MRYCMEVYYGAMLTVNNKDRIMFSIKRRFDDVSVVASEVYFSKLEKVLENDLKIMITKSGFNPDNFWYDYLTKQEYDEYYSYYADVVE